MDRRATMAECLAQALAGVDADHLLPTLIVLTS